MNTELKQSERIQTSLLNPIEKKILVWLARRMPAWVTSDMLTFTGFCGSLIMAAGYALSHNDLHWLWLSSFGLLVNWFGDSLDGSLARVRDTQRKIYGFYIDHNVDVINETIMFIGLGLSPLVNMSFAMLALVAYFMISIYVYINCHLKGEMRLTYGGLGPTEFRLILVVINTLFIYIPFLSRWKMPVTLFHKEMLVGVFDFAAVGAALIIFIFYLTGFFKDARYFARLDPGRKKEA